jgi:tetratricopeptide (TPR) repeat protein/transglutaminase-like putative cysteine protease
MRIRRVGVLAALFFVTCSILVGQTTPPSPDFPQEAVVVEEILNRFAFQDDGSSTQLLQVRARLQSEAGVQQYGILNFGYDNSREEVEVKVQVRRPDGTVLETPSADIQDITAEISRSAPMYTDFREKHIAVKGLIVGSVLEYEFRRKTRMSFFPGHFWLAFNFDDSDIVLTEKLEVSYPATRKVTVRSGTVQPVVTTDAGRKKYVWTTKNLKRIEDNTVRRIRPLADVRLTSLSDWQQVGDWYEGLQSSRVQPSAAVIAKAREIIKDSTTEEQKIRAIYEYVSNSYRYIAISFGIGVVQPHSADEILRNGYGDCKDKHTLMAALLGAIGIKAYPGLISADLPLESDLPAPNQFNHVLTIVPRANGDTWWLDTTPEVAPFRMLLTNLRSRPALVIRGVGASKIETSPAFPPFPAAEAFSLVGKLDATGVLKAKIDRTLRSDAEVLFRIAFHRTPRSKWKDLVQTVSYASGFGGEVDNPIVSSPENTSSALSIKFDYTRKEFGDRKNGYIPDALPPIFNFLIDEKKTLVEPLPIGIPGIRLDYQAELELPAGSRPVPPQPLHLDNEFFSYSSEYQVVGDQVVIKRVMELKIGDVKPDQVARLRKLTKQISEHESEQISVRGEFLERASDADDDSDGLFEQARSALQIQDLDTAMRKLKQLTAKTPDYPGAWMMIGGIHQARGKSQEAIEALKKEADLHPKDTRAQKFLAFGYMAMNRSAEAEVVWRKLLEIDQSDRDAAANLGTLLLDQKKYGEAELMLAESVRLNPESDSLYRSLAFSQLGNGKNDQALVSMKKVLEIDDSPTNFNDLAYTLAVKDTMLDQALAWSLDAVARAEKDANQISLDDLEIEDLGRTRRLGNFWDTLGWVYFRKQQYEHALPYLRAAWELSHIRGIGEHLAELYERQHLPQEAAKIYALAYAANRSESSPARERLRRLVGDVAANRMLGTAGTELSNLRAIKLPRLKTPMWSGEFFILFSTKEGVKDVLQVSGDEMPAVKEAILQLKWHTEYPPGVETRLLRRGLAMCSKIGGCNLVLYPPEAVKTIH